ncbi:hypothetical protein [Comamonas endophytica]|uniref:Uncharacterized protein n=1 Tax=Comamonas endophytica TaxID=2949090 RepID=A0ABY6GHK9_9BURK|nr:MULTISPECIES: hypothetical protein [unclassified Acidovorax]MCD2513375.1 hypothetical protein [Acidovorax sp. D4N7]UYG53842.1 hypothetical protein M9799_18070 [Acidovorax sp. 5MLIR]
MSKLLRSIAVYVEEPKRGSFAWVLIERENADTWREIERAHHHADSYHGAMADGLLALQAMTEDLDQGPRESAGQRSAGHAGGEASFFGFGPAR